MFKLDLHVFCHLALPWCYVCLVCVCVGMMGVLCPPLYKYKVGSDSNTTTKEIEGIAVEVKIVICLKLLNISKTQR